MAHVAWLAVFVLGLRHGVDPDHLAAIDSLTRRSARSHPVVSRFVGTLFAGGHSMVVVTIAALAGYFGTRLSAYGQALESVGTWASIGALIALAIINLVQLSRPMSVQPIGLRSRLLPRTLYLATHPLAAVPTGMIFGLGFDTASQVAAYALAFSSGRTVLSALVVGAVFSVGMTVVDTFTSFALARAWQRSDEDKARMTRVWTLYVAVLTLSIATYEIAQATGVQPRVPDLAVSALVIASAASLLAITMDRRRLPQNVP